MEEFYKLLALDIPKVPANELGFLDVVGHTTRETTICNVYRYFLDPELSPHISPLMLETLKGLIDEKYNGQGVTKELDLTDFGVKLEHGTGSGRIDIALESPATQSVVIIEAKVYHSLQNDLEDYWNYFKYPAINKAGIVLSLESLSEAEIGNSNFVSITHCEWLNQVRGKGLPVGLPVKEYIYFNDFVNNMNNLTKPRTMNASAEFYIEHSDKVKRAIKTQSEAYNYAVSSVERVAAHFGWTAYGTSSYWRNLWNQEEKETVYITAYPETIADEKGKVKLILEIYGVAIPFEKELRGLLPSKMMPEYWNGGGKMHLASMTYNLALKDLPKLSEKMIEFIEKDFEPVRKDLLKFLKKKDAHQQK